MGFVERKGAGNPRTSSIIRISPTVLLYTPTGAIAASFRSDALAGGGRDITFLGRQR